MDFLCKSFLLVWLLLFSLSENSSGLIPRWLLEIATIVISNMIIHFLKSQLPSGNEVLPMYEYMAAVCEYLQMIIILIFFVLFFSLLLKLLHIH